MKLNKMFLLLTLALSLSLTACGGLASVPELSGAPWSFFESNAQPVSESNAPELNGTSWLLVEINAQPVLENIAATLVFEAEQVGGNGSCNTFGGDYQAENGQLTFGSLFSTMMYCEGIMEQETAFLAALQEAASYQVKDGNLLILNADGLVTLTLAPQ